MPRSCGARSRFLTAAIASISHPLRLAVLSCRYSRRSPSQSLQAPPWGSSGRSGRPRPLAAPRIGAGAGLGQQIRVRPGTTDPSQARDNRSESGPGQQIRVRPGNRSESGPGPPGSSNNNPRVPAATGTVQHRVPAATGTVRDGPARVPRSSSTRGGCPGLAGLNPGAGSCGAGSSGAVPGRGSGAGRRDRRTAATEAEEMMANATGALNQLRRLFRPFSGPPLTV